MRIQDILQGQAVHEEDPVLRLSMLTAVIRAEGCSPGVIVSSIGPESAREISRTETESSEEDGAAVIRIRASDVSSMRAALNSCMECIRVIEDIHNLTEARI